VSTHVINPKHGRVHVLDSADYEPTTYAPFISLLERAYRYYKIKGGRYDSLEPGQPLRLFYKWPVRTKISQAVFYKYNMHMTMLQLINIHFFVIHQCHKQLVVGQRFCCETTAVATDV